MEDLDGMFTDRLFEPQLQGHFTETLHVVGNLLVEEVSRESADWRGPLLSKGLDILNIANAAFPGDDDILKSKTRTEEKKSEMNSVSRGASLVDVATTIIDLAKKNEPIMERLG